MGLVNPELGMGLVSPELPGLPELDGLSLPSGRVLQQEDREYPGSGTVEAALALGSEESFMEGTLRQGTVQQACPSLPGVSISWDTRERFQAGRMLRLEVIFFCLFVL